MYVKGQKNKKKERKKHPLKSGVIKELVEPGGGPGSKRKRWKKEIKDSVEYIHQRSLNDKGCH